ncbi:MAG: hypothetical protein ACTSQJ_17650 [Promethearchaeota archaeon]
MVLSAQPSIIWFWYFWQLDPDFNLVWFILFPVAFFIGVIILILSAIFTAKLFLIIINFIHKPREGVFNRNKSDKDYCYWCLRSVVKKWPLWLSRQLFLPILEKLSFKILGIKIPNSTSLHEGWVDCEFIEFGKRVRIGQGSIIMSNIIIGDKLIIKKVIIKDNVIIGAHSVVSPGTIIEENTVLESISMTAINQRLEANSIYSGNPARKIKDNKPLSDEEIKRLNEIIFEESPEKNYDKSNLRAVPHELSVPYLFYAGSGWVIVGFSFLLPGFLFYLYLFGFLVPNFLSINFSFELLLNFKIIIIMLFIPLVFIGLYLLHLFFIALLTKLFYSYVDPRGPAQGVFDRKLNETSHALDYYHARSFLLKYPVFAIFRSPFPWLINWELRFIGSNKIGKDTVLESGAYIHSHINYGKNCYVGTFAHNTNHLVDGVYGEENLTFFGAEVGNNCVFNALTGGLPGLETGDNVTMLPMASTIKYDKLGNNGIYAGFPVKKLKKEEIKKFLGGMVNGE